MTNTARTAPSPPPSATLARLAIGAAVTYQVMLLALIFLRPDLDPSWHTISEWAIGSYGWLMTAAFLISGLSYASLFLMLRTQVRGALGRTGLGVLFLCVIGTFGVGGFRTDPPPFFGSMSTVGALHVVCGTSALFLLPFGALLINLSLALKSPSWMRARGPLLWTAALPLLGFVSFMSYTVLFVVPLGPGAYGPGVHVGWPPRVAFLTYMLWVVTLSLRAIRLREPPAPADEARRAVVHSDACSVGRATSKWTTTRT